MKKQRRQKQRLAGILTHETSRVSLVGPDLVVNKDMTLHQNRLYLTVCQSILQPVPQNEDQGQAFPRLVWPG
ncbi:hypothetical protein Hanom_Chr10g00896601 [Helianthus anomalus]